MLQKELEHILQQLIAPTRCVCERERARRRERGRKGEKKYKVFKQTEKNVSGCSMEHLRDGKSQLVNSNHQGLLTCCWLVSP